MVEMNAIHDDNNGITFFWPTSLFHNPLLESFMFVISHTAVRLSYFLMTPLFIVGC